MTTRVPPMVRPVVDAPSTKRLEMLPPFAPVTVNAAGVGPLLVPVPWEPTRPATVVLKPFRSKVPVLLNRTTEFGDVPLTEPAFRLLLVASDVMPVYVFVPARVSVTPAGPCTA